MPGLIFFARCYGIGPYTFFPPHIQYGVLKYNKLTRERGMNMSEEIRGGYGYGHGAFTSTGAILVLFILLVIISRSLFV